MLFAKIGTDKTVPFGPVLAADGTMSNGALAYTDAKIFKNGTDGALNASATFTHKYEGVYALLLKAADLDAVGDYEVVLNKNPLSASPVEITVLAANVYDWLFGTAAPSTLTQTDMRSALGMADADLDTQLDAILAAAGNGGGTGANSVTITVDDGTNPLESAKVRMTKGAESYLLTTNASGVAAFSLDNGTWTVHITLPLYTFTATTLVVDGTETQTYSMTAQTITAPSAPDTCTVQFRVFLSGVPVQGAVCKAKLIGVNQASDGTILSNEDSSDTTDAQGVAELELVQRGAIIKGSGIYDMRVEIAGSPVASVKAAIPNQSTVLFEDLL